MLKAGAGSGNFNRAGKGFCGFKGLGREMRKTEEQSEMRHFSSLVTSKIGQRTKAASIYHVHGPCSSKYGPGPWTPYVYHPLLYGYPSEQDGATSPGRET